jgi:hypothetical protein
MNMTSTKTVRKLGYSSILAAVLLTACGGESGVSTPPSGPGTPADVDFVVTSVDAITASVAVNNNSAVSLDGVQVLVSTFTAVDTSSDGSGTAVAKDVVLYNSIDELATSPAVVSGGKFTFILKNVNFAAASNDTSGAASAASCSGSSDTALGEVLLEVLNQGDELKRETVPVCALQGKTYSVTIN